MAAAAEEALVESESKSEIHLWMSKLYSRWSSVKEAMPAGRQRELIEEYIATLPGLPGGCSRTLQPPPREDPQLTLRRDERVELRPSADLPTLTGVFFRSAESRLRKRDARLLDYRGWILSESEYERFGYAVHTAVPLPGLLSRTSKTSKASETGSDRYLLLGDPTAPAAQINCRTGTTKAANVRLVLDTNERKKVVRKKKEVSQAIVTVCVASDATSDGEELWLDYGEAYWQQIGLYCPHCLEYGSADENDRMLLCDAPGCKRAWHQLCLQPCVVDVPKGVHFCDVHAIIQCPHTVH